MSKRIEELSTQLRELHLLKKEEVATIQKVGKLVASCAQRLNLTATTDVYTMWINLALESCFALPELSTGQTILDIGSGNGIPGLVWATLRPDVEFVLAERIGKKALALEQIRSQLNLRNTTIYPGDIITMRGRQFDIITARAVAPINQLWELSSSLRKKGTKYVLFRGSDEILSSKLPEGLFEEKRVTIREITLWVGVVQ